MIFDKNDITSAFLPRIRELWLSSPDTFPDFLSRVSPEEKRSNEAWVTAAMERLQRHMKAFPSRNRIAARLPFSGKQLEKTAYSRTSSPQLKKWTQEMETLFHGLLFDEPILGIRRAMSEDSLSAFQASMKDFLRQVRSFAPEMKAEDMGQALRNFMVYSIFREQNGLPQDCPSSIFGYSMLYPFTDNFLDDPQRTSEEKKHFNLLIHHKISGIPITPLSVHEEKTAQLLADIAAAYPSAESVASYGEAAGDDIRQGLLLMLEAQEISQKQTDASRPLTEQNIMDISIYKGGLSVLIDRFFINLKMTEEDILFYFGFGFLLQLCDDLQDIGEDKENGSRTLLSSCNTPQETAARVNRLFSYTAALFDFCPCRNPAFRDFLLQNCHELILTSAAGSGSWFGDDYLKKLEDYLPVSLSFLSGQKEKLPAAFPAGNEERMMEMLDAFLCES